MAKCKLITDFEKDVIRMAVAMGHKDREIAEFMGRSRPVVATWRAKMEKDGTIHDLPFEFVADMIRIAPE